MSTPETNVERSDLDTAARAKQDKLTQSVGTRLTVPTNDGKAPWWKRLLGGGK